jgi:hypothetical protein
MSPVEDNYPDVLQNIEFGVVSTYRQHREMSDYNVIRVLEALIDGYTAEKLGRPERNARLSELEQVLAARVRGVCEWRLGRGEPDGLPVAGETAPDPITVDEIVVCLRRIVKSANRWNKQGGKQGYLNFVIQYVR